MWRYIVRRLLQTIPVVLGATLLIYALVFLQPGDPIVALFGEKPVSEAARAELEAQYNLDQPFLIQWLLFLKGALVGDFGTSYSGQPVADLIARSLPVTFQLAFMAMIIEAILGVAAGFYAGLRRGGIFDSTMLVVSLIVIAIPIFVLGFALQLVFGVQLQWVPPTVGSATTFTNLLLPAVVLGLVSFAYVLRLTRTSVIENLTADHVRTARAHGVSGRSGQPTPRASQLVDPRGHLFGCRSRDTHGRSSGHRRNLQYQRYRQPGVSSDLAWRKPNGRLCGHDHGADLRGRQPAC